MKALACGWHAYTGIVPQPSTRAAPVLRWESQELHRKTCTRSQTPLAFNEPFTQKNVGHQRTLTLHCFFHAPKLTRLAFGRQSPFCASDPFEPFV